MAAKRKRAKKTAKKHAKKHAKRKTTKIAKRPAKRKTSKRKTSKRKAVFYGPHYDKRQAGKGSKGQVPAYILQDRVVHLNNILKKRGYAHFAGTVER